MERVKGREGVISKKVDLFGLCGGASAPVAPTLPTGLDQEPIKNNPVGTKISNNNNWTNCEVETYYSQLYSSSETRGQLVGKIECSW